VRTNSTGLFLANVDVTVPCLLLLSAVAFRTQRVESRNMKSCNVLKEKTICCHITAQVFKTWFQNVCN